MATTEPWVVVVRHNLVCSIARAGADDAARVAASPLEVSTRLADNHRANGCIDGRYCVADAQSARIFATLCLEFTRALAEKRLAMVEKLPAGNSRYEASDSA